MKTIVHNAEAIAAARAMYEEGAAVRAIVRETGLSEGTLYYWLDGGPPGAAERLAPLPRRREVLGQRRQPLKTSRGSLIARLWRTAERQVADIETRLVEAGGNPDALAQDAKTLAVLARTVRDLVALDAEQSKGEKAEPSDEEANAPLDIEDFRQRIAAKMAELAEERAVP